MPITYRIDPERRLVLAEGHGTLTDQDVFDYQRTVWSCPEVAGYDELMDMTDVETIALPSADRIPQLAMVSAGMDSSAAPSKFAIVAAGDLAFGLGRMYAAYRALDSRSTKEVGVFRTWAEAWEWLGHGDSAQYPDVGEGTGA